MKRADSHSLLPKASLQPVSPSQEDVLSHQAQSLPMQPRLYKKAPLYN